MSDELRMTVTPGACQLQTVVIVRDHDDGVEIELDTECPIIRKLNAALDVVDPFEAMEMPYEVNSVYSVAGRIISHASCPVPFAIVKCVEAHTGMAVKKDVFLRYED